VKSLPAVFVSHGSPMQALNGGATALAWRALAADLPAPRAVLAVSAHWETAAPTVSSAPSPATIHDFGGFPEPLFRIQYPAPGAPWLATRVRALLVAGGFAADIDPAHGLDHGAWVPLREMYPAADVPVAQLSIQSHLGPGHHLRLGRALAALKDEGVLTVASGSLTHNLRDWRPNAPAGTATAGYVAEFQAWIHERLIAGDAAAIVEYRQRAPGATRAHPTDEHLLPLFVALGAGGEGAVVRRRHAEIVEGALAMDLYTFAKDAIADA
jgi:4,5-DOPA dioxygenase extradiol